MAANPQQAEQFRAGKQALIGYFVGQVMRPTGGRAEPKRCRSSCARCSVPDRTSALTNRPVGL